MAQQDSAEDSSALMAATEDTGSEKNSSQHEV